MADVYDYNPKRNFSRRDSDEMLEIYRGEEYHNFLKTWYGIPDHHHMSVFTNRDLTRAMYSLEWIHLNKKHQWAMIAQHPDLTVRDLFNLLECY